MFKSGNNIKHLTSKVLAHFLAVILTFSNCFTSYALTSTIVPDSNIPGNNVYMDKSANNIPVVNINDPNNAGVSHNHFTDFNVGTRGTVINNSAVNAVSKIGGVVTGNANLTRHADTIINEVTGTSRSQILGPQEILGKSADYILANPNGISVNGGEFINTQSATFTTGKVLLNSKGQLEKFLIEEGDVEIDGVDIDLSNLDYFEIIARSVKLNTAIYAKRDKELEDSQDTELSVVAGAGEYNVKSKKLTPKHTDSDVPSFAIDTSKLGGLYAGKIRLVSSEAGVGVNLPDIQSTTGDIEITADGKITHKNIASTNKLKVTSNNDKIVATANKKAVAQGDTQYSAKGGIELQNASIIASHGSVQLESADGMVKNQGIIVSQGKRGISVDANGVKNSGIMLTDSGTLGAISISSRDTIENSGIIKTDLALTTTFQNGFHNTGKIISKTSIHRGDSFENAKDAEIHVQDVSLVYLSEDFANAGSITTENFGVASKSGRLVNSGLIKSKSVNFRGSEFENSDGAEMHVRERALISLDDDFTNAGHLYSVGLEVTSKSGEITNSGIIVSAKGGSFDAYLDFINTGTIATVIAPLQITSRTQRLVNSGKVSAPKIGIITKGDIQNSDTIQTSLLDVTSTHGGLSNSGTVKSLGTARITLAADFSNEGGVLFATQDLALSTEGVLLNDSEAGIVSKGGMSLKATGKIENEGHVEARKSISAVTDSTLDNSGNMIADSNIILSSIQGVVNAVSGVIKSIGAQEITSESGFNNQGKVESKTASVTLSARDDIENSGSITARRDITSNGSQNIANSGSILASRTLDLRTLGRFINRKDASVGSGKSLTIVAVDNVDNQGEILALDGTATVKSSENIVNREGGNISAKLGTEIRADRNIANSGKLISRGVVDIIAGENIHNADKGQIGSAKSITVSSQTQSITNDGMIGAATDVTLESETAVENNGHVLSGGAIEVSGQSIANRGQINAAKSTKLSAKDDVENIDSGLIKSGGDLTITSAEGHIKNTNSDPDEFNESGIISTAKATIKAALGFENTKAHMESGKSLEVSTTGSFLNDSGNMIAGKSLTLRVDGDVQNLNGGAMQGLKGLDISSFDSLSPSRSFQNRGTITAGLASKDTPTIMGKVNVLTKETLENSGIIQATNDVVLEVTEGEIQNRKIILSKSGAVTAKSSEDIDNSGLVESSQVLSLVSEDGSIENSGIIVSDDGGVDLTAKTKVDHTDGIIKAKEDLSITAETEGVTVDSNVVSTDSDLTITSHDDISSTGILQAKGDITITTTDGSFHNDSGNVLTADGTVNISATSVKNDSTDSKNGYLQGHELHVVATSGNVENAGVMHSKTGGEVRAKNSVINNQNIELGDGSTISATDKDVTNTGLILSTRALEISAADTISNSGEINVPELTLKTARVVDNKTGAGISSSGQVTMVNTPTIKNDGLVDFGVMDATTGITSVTNSGTLKGGTLSITASTFNNTGRTELSGGANLDVTSLTSNVLTAGGRSDIAINGNYTNTGKLHVDGADLSITADSITNKSGAVLKARSITATARGGGTFTNEGTIFGKSGVVVASPAISNTSTGYLVSGTTLGLTGGTVTNYGGISSVQNMAVKGALDNRGDIRTQKALAITGAVTNSGRISGKDKVGITGNLTNSGRIASNSNVAVAGGSSIYNSGIITSHGSMDLDNSSLTNTNVLEAVGTLSTYQSGNITNSSSIYGGTVNLRSTGGSITNNARIIAKNNMSLQAAGDVINKNQIGLTGTGTLAITAGGSIKNDREYKHAYKFIDRTYLETYKTPPLQRSERQGGRLINHYADWNWFKGDIGKYKPSGYVFGKYSLESDNPELDQLMLGFMNMFGQGRKHITGKPYNKINQYYYHDQKVGGQSISHIVPKILSGGNITLHASGGDINNVLGVVQARNNITVSGSNLKNNDVVQNKHVIVAKNTKTYEIIQVPYSSGQSGTKDWEIHHIAAYPLQLGDPIELDRVPSIIQAGGSISGSLAGKVTLGSVDSGGSKSGISGPSGGGVSGSGTYLQVTTEPKTLAGSGASYTQSKPTSGARSLEVVDIEAGKFAPPKIESRKSLAELSRERMKIKATGSTISVQLAKTSMDNSSLSTLAGAIADTYASPPIPTAPEISWEFDDPEIMKAIGTDWTKSKSSGRYYIQETSPVFTDIGTYFSTDNFIKRIEGFEPKKQTVSSQQPTRLHFGDSMKQMDFVRRQMIELTGHASLEDDIDYAKQIKNLYETGIRYGKDMKLSAGTSLTEEQVNALQDDMVWAEEIEIRGTKVIVPRLYVAKSKREKRASGLLARNINISADSIENNGSNIVGEDVRLQARTGDITNEGGGDIYASKHLGLDSARDIRNVGSSITSDGSGFITAGRNIENITESQRYGDEKNHITTVGKQSTIKVRGPLAMLSGGDLVNKGSSIESGDLLFAIGGSMINDSIEDSESMETVFSGGHFKKKSVVYKPATITSTGTTEGFVAGNFTLIGSRISSSGDSTIKVGGTSVLMSQVNSDMSDSHMEYTTSGTFSDNDHVHSHQSLTQTLAESSITAGGKSVLINEGDQVLQGARVHGGKGTFLKGRKTSMLATRLRNMKSDFEYDEGTITNTTDSTGFDNVGHVHSSLSGGGEQIVDSDIVESDFTSKTGKGNSDSIWGSLFTDMTLNTPLDHQKPSWAKKLEASGRSVTWHPVTDSSKSWDHHSEVLNPEFATIVSIAAAICTMYAGGFGMFASEGATVTMGTTMQQAAVTGLASSGAVSMINNKFDFGKVASDLASPDSLYNLGLNTLTAGLTFGISQGLDIGQIKAGMDLADRATILAKTGAIGVGVRGALSSGTGEKLAGIVRGETLSGGLALGQSVVGDVADKKGFKTGSAEKVAMHTLTGTAYSALLGNAPKCCREA